MRKPWIDALIETIFLLIVAVFVGLWVAVTYHAR